MTSGWGPPDTSSDLFPELGNGSWDFDVLSLLQPLLTLDQVVDPVDQQLDQLHLHMHAQRRNRRSEIPDVESHDQGILTSDLPRRSLLEMSKVSPVAAVSTPPVPLFCRRRLSRILLNRESCSGFVCLLNHTRIVLRQYERIIHWCVCVCVFYLAEFWQTYVNSSPEAGAQVRGTCEDVAKMLVPHKFPPSFLDQVLHL